jgi:hypothetical protein
MRSSGDFAQPRKHSGLRPARLERPVKDLLEMITVHGDMKKNDICVVFRPDYSPCEAGRPLVVNGTGPAADRAAITVSFDPEN